tara:strand:- start:5138 stop:5281 length:144 start_codon:yes stop_codon:yes gene_type:complete
MSKKEEKEFIPKTLHNQAWERAMKGGRPNAGTPHDWEEYEKVKEEKD